MDLSNLSGPIVGAVIGYGTNWLAIKMLFRPVKPIKIGRFTLPFTPGIIPKRKEKLAKAIGEMVGNKLFTKRDIENRLLSEEVEETIVCKVMSFFTCEDTIKSVLLDNIEEKTYWQVRENLKEVVSEKIKDGLLQLQIGELIRKEGAQVIRTKVKGGFLRMFVTDDLIDSFLEPMGAEFEKYLQEQGQEKIRPVVERQMDSIENMTVKDFMEQFQSKEFVEKIRMSYRTFVVNRVGSFLEKLDITSVVEEKVKQMEVLELEKLLLSVMKKELGALVNLGALLGFVLGTLNIFF